MNKKALLIGGCALAVVAIVVALIFIFTGGGNAYRSIKVFEIDGSCKVDRGGDSLDAFKNMALSSGDSLTVGEGSFARLKLDDDKYVYLEANTKINLTATGTANDSKTMVYIERGSMLTEVKKKLSATSSYDIVTPNTTMSIRGTKTLTEVYEDVLGAIKTSAAVVEGQVSFKTVQKDSTGKAVVVSTDLSVGQGFGVTTEKKDLLSQADIKQIAEDGKTADGQVAEETTHEELGTTLEAPAFSEDFLTNVVAVLARSREEDVEEGFVAEDITEEELSAAINVLNDVIDGKILLPASVEEYIISQTQPYYDEPVGFDEPVTGDGSGEIEGQQAPIEDPAPVTDDTVAPEDPEGAGDDTFVVDGTGETLVGIADDTDDEGAAAADDRVDDDQDDGADEAEDTDDADETDEDDSDESDEDEEDDESDEDEEGTDEEDGDDEDTDEASDEEDTDEEDGDETDTEDESDEEDDDDESNTATDPNGVSSSTDGTYSNTPTPSDGGSGIPSGGSASEREIPVRFEQTEKTYTTEYTENGQTYQSSYQVTVSFIKTSTGEKVSGSGLPGVFREGSTLPGVSGSGYETELMIGENAAPEYEFTGWYLNPEDASRAGEQGKITSMPSSSASGPVNIYAGIRKRLVTVIITNLFPESGDFVIPTDGTDDEGHTYTKTDNRIEISGFEIGDEFRLPEESVLASASGSIDDKIYISGSVREYGGDHSSFICYSTLSDLNVGRIKTLEAPEEAYPDQLFMNNTGYAEYPGEGVNDSITLSGTVLNDFKLNLYAYFAEKVRVEVDRARVKVAGTAMTLSEILSGGNGPVVVETTGSSNEIDKQWWSFFGNSDSCEMSTWYEGYKSVKIPEFTLADGDNPNRRDILCRYEEGAVPKPFINNGEFTVSSSFPFYNNKPQSVLIKALNVPYAVIDLSGEYSIRQIGDSNPYYIKKEGDISSNRFEIALIGLSYDEAKGSVTSVAGTAQLPEESNYHYDTPVSTAFSLSQQGYKTRYYVSVPDDAYYPWGMRGEPRTDNLQELSIESSVGVFHAGFDPYVGIFGKKLIGYNVSYDTANNTVSQNLIYAEAVRHQASDYSIMLFDDLNTYLSVGALWSLGLESERIFTDASAGQIVLKPIFGPAAPLFTLGIVYKNDDQDTPRPYVRVGDIENEYKEYVTSISLTDAQIEYFDLTAGSTSTGYSTVALRDLWYNAEPGIKRFMPSTINDTIYCGEMTQDTQTGKWYQDIPFLYAADTSGLSPDSVYFVRGLKKTNESDPNPVYISYGTKDCNDCQYVASSYCAAANPAVRIADDSYYQYTGFVSYTQNGSGQKQLTRVVDERKDSFEPWQSVKDLQYCDYRWGGILCDYAESDKTLYGWQGQPENASVDYVNMKIAFNTSGNIHSVLHGTSTYRFAGLLAQDGERQFTHVSISNKSDVTCYIVSKSGNGVTFTNGEISGYNSSNKMDQIEDIKDLDWLALYMNDQETPQNWMCVEAGDNYYWFKVGLEGSITDGEALITEFTILV